MSAYGESLLGYRYYVKEMASQSVFILSAAWWLDTDVGNI